MASLIRPQDVADRLALVRPKRIFPRSEWYGATTEAQKKSPTSLPGIFQSENISVTATPKSDQR
jgi:hypothetical protein